MKESVVIQAERIACDFLQEQVKTSYQIIGKGITNQICVRFDQGLQIDSPVAHHLGDFRIAVR